MQERQDRPDYPTVNDPSFPPTPGSGENGGTAVSVLEPYVPPNVPHGLPHVVRFATLSSMDLPLEVRFLIIMIARFANVNGVASVAASTLCEICRIGSHHTVDRWLGLAADVGIVHKEPGKGGKDRKSNSYTFQGAERAWAPLPVGRPDLNPIVALAQARRLIEELTAKAARVDELEAELVLLRNGHANGHATVTNGSEGASPETGAPSYEPGESDISSDSHEAIGHPGVPNRRPGDLPEVASPSYEAGGADTPPDSHTAIGHSEVTNGSPENPSGTSPSYETPHSDASQDSHWAIGHSQVTNGSDEGQEYLDRRARVEGLVQEHYDHYERSFTRGGALAAMEYFSRSAANEDELNRQVKIRRSGRNAAVSGTSPPADTAGRAPPVDPRTGRREVEYCPDCSSPYTTFNGEERCPDCTGHRRRESEA